MHLYMAIDLSLHLSLLLLLMGLELLLMGQLNHIYDMLLHPRLELLVLMVKSNQLVHSLVPAGVVAFPSDALGAFASST